MRVVISTKSQARNLIRAQKKKNFCAQNLKHAKICTFEVSNVFRDCQVLICDFHREQA